MAEEDDDLERARRGDRDAFGRLVRRHQRRVYAAALHILGSHNDADDVAQEAFVRAYRGLAAFDGRADFFTWLYRITVNTALNALRSGRRGALSAVFTVIRYS
ncbi:MAG TPA: sigma-70 family RNA polymerase sigma factor, partial [Kofleriaceae bacterium]|nr:sigma-70 family RNA polymerase sigma factor [Kofleriaceae bacterium]